LLNFINVHLANSKFASGPIITSVFRNSQHLFFVCAQISQRSLICPTNLQESSHYINLRKSVVKLIDTFVNARKSSLRDLRILCRSCYGTTHDGSRKTSCEHHHWRHYSPLWYYNAAAGFHNRNEVSLNLAVSQLQGENRTSILPTARIREETRGI
jgi:hypothetical protein